MSDVFLQPGISGLSFDFFGFFLPSPLVSLAGAATSSIFVATKMCLSRQCVCRNKNVHVFVATKLGQTFVAPKVV